MQVTLARSLPLLVLAAALAAGCSKGAKDAPSNAPTPTAATPATAGSSAPAPGAAPTPAPAAGSAGSAGAATGSANGAGAAAAAPPGATPAAPSENLLGLASGAYLVKQPPSDRAFDNSPINLIFDGATWRSTEGQVTDQVFVIETPGVTTLTSVGFDTHHMFYAIDENARSVALEASATGADAGFQPILVASLAKESAITVLPVTATVPARWFRLTIKDNHGSASATALQRILGYGTQQLPPTPTNLTGTYRPLDAATGKVGDKGGDIFIKQDGTTMVGCWRAAGSFAGGLTGPVANVTWTQPDLGTNSALMVFAGGTQAVFWRRKSDAFWALETFTRVNANLEVCGDGTNLKAADATKTGLAKQLADTGRAVVYGINFDFNSDKLRDESKVILDTIVRVLKDNPDWKMAIEGHTDSIGGGPFNQALSEKRAAAVVAYLTRASIEPGRLSARGAGLTSPIDSNDTDLGRARNRRVELVKQ